MKSKYQKREEAAQRQGEYDKLTLDQKIALLPKTGAKKQREKLTNQKG